MDNNSNFWIACSNGQIDLVNHLINTPGVDPGVDNNRSLLRAIENGHEAVVDRLLQDPRVDPRVPGGNGSSPPIIYAAFYDRLAILERLLRDPRIDPSIHNNRPLYMAVNYGNLDIVHRLLQDSRVDPRSVAYGFLLESPRTTQQNKLNAINRLLNDPRVNGFEVLLIQYNKIVRCYSEDIYQFITWLIQLPKTKAPTDPRWHEIITWWNKQQQLHN